MPLCLRFPRRRCRHRHRLLPTPALCGTTAALSRQKATVPSTWACPTTLRPESTRRAPGPVWTRGKSTWVDSTSLSSEPWRAICSHIISKRRLSRSYRPLYAHTHGMMPRCAQHPIHLVNFKPPSLFPSLCRDGYLRMLATMTMGNERETSVCLSVCVRLSVWQVQASPLVDSALKPSGKKLSQLKNELRAMNQDPSYYPQALLERVARQSTKDLLKDLRNMVTQTDIMPSIFFLCFGLDGYIWMRRGEEKKKLEKLSASTKVWPKTKRNAVVDEMR